MSRQIADLRISNSAVLRRMERARLYLLAMNRADKGLLTLVSYNAIRARPDPWQRGIPWSDLGSYLETLHYDNWCYQELAVLNTTLELSSGQWRNQAWLGGQTG